jgi:hypothetical protein
VFATAIRFHTQAYYDAAKITAVKCFIVQAQGEIVLKHFSKLKNFLEGEVYILAIINLAYPRVEHLKDALLG